MYFQGSPILPAYKLGGPSCSQSRTAIQTFAGKVVILFGTQQHPLQQILPGDLLAYLFWKQSADDASQFDSKFTSQTPVDSPDDSMLSESANQVFLVSK